MGTLIAKLHEEKRARSPTCKGCLFWKGGCSRGRKPFSKSCAMRVPRLEVSEDGR